MELHAPSPVQRQIRIGGQVRFSTDARHKSEEIPSDDPRAYYKYSLIVLDTSTSDAISFSANERS
jgi:hypothetical protein